MCERRLIAKVSVINNLRQRKIVETRLKLVRACKNLSYPEMLRWVVRFTNIRIQKTACRHYTCYTSYKILNGIDEVDKNKLF